MVREKKTQNYALSLTATERTRFEQLVTTNAWIRVEVLTRLVRSFLSMADEERVAFMCQHAAEWSPSRPEDGR